jgi:hypothetical protein
MRRPAEELWEALNSVVDDKKREASHYVESAINEHIKRRLRWRLCVGTDPTVAGALRPITVDDITHIFTEFLVGCDVGKRNISNDAQAKHWAPSFAWNKMVGLLATFYEGLSGSHKATAPHNRQRDTDPPSRFVAFVNAVQFQLPDEYRAYSHASKPDWAATPLQSQISNALNIWRKSKGDSPSAQ